MCSPSWACRYAGVEDLSQIGGGQCYGKASREHGLEIRWSAARSVYTGIPSCREPLEICCVLCPCLLFGGICCVLCPCLLFGGEEHVGLVQDEES